MSWNHAVCEADWTAMNPDRKPVRVVRQPEEPIEPLPCCYCENLTTSGIYVRADPFTLRCRGAGAAHTD